jgi:predicted enzyme related to lactoylglutathione lyase
MQVQYPEIATPDVEAPRAALEEMRGARFGVRAPMHESEQPAVRPYVLVDDIEGAVETARAAGAVITHPPLEIPGHGTFAIYLLGGIHHGLWQL